MCLTEQVLSGAHNLYKKKLLFLAKKINLLIYAAQRRKNRLRPSDKFIVFPEIILHNILVHYCTR